MKRKPLYQSEIEDDFMDVVTHLQLGLPLKTGETFAETSLEL